jgi:hypothetical protein
MRIENDHSDLEREILHTITYFDVFSYPLTKEQLYAFLYYAAASDIQLEDSLHRLIQQNLLHSSQGYYYLSGRTEEIVASRLENEQRASRMLRHARWVSFFLKQMPFVRAIFITGSLSKHVAPHKSDIDFMIIAEIDRLWICKMILTAFRRIVLFNSKKYFCINLMVTENGLYFPHHNYYTAIEIATTQIVWNTAAFERYQKENVWIRDYLPHWHPLPATVRHLADAPSVFQRLLEQGLNILKLDVMNTSLMHTARNFWRHKHKNIIEESKFESIIQCTPDISSVWHDDHQSRIYEGFHQRMAAFGMDEVR